MPWAYSSSSWFQSFGWIIPLVFLCIFLVFFLFHWRRWGEFPFSACHSPHRKHYLEEKVHLQEKIEELEQKIDGSSNSRMMEKKIEDLEIKVKELERKDD